ncbi:ead/Ea22-like family protein [Citrobacter koseri]|uniref:ead/Ea22-like family protein n=1 Tax=Citrobacter koseri TaxID=545 RepID=UPI002943A2A3|nr:ead/Ea22-like family protein [Citrobacter koseri]WOI93125.1 ead/Ea22-like family protein [Citrobacter koseri]
MSNIDKQALREAAEKYRTTYAAHLKNPRNYDALDAWDKATSEFMALVNNDELNIIASLIDEIDMETGYREGAFVACNRWHTKFRETEAKLEAAEKRIAELEARTVKLPEALVPAIHNSGEPFMRPDPFGLHLNLDDVLKALRAAGIGKGE